jgi:hypothetical protein
MCSTHFFTKTVFCAFMALIFTNQLFAKLPDQYEITNFATDSIRLGITTLSKYDYNATRIYHPFFTESINAILNFYQTKYQLAKHENRIQDTTADYYLNTLKQNQITIYKMNNLQGKVLRAIINSNIPVLLIGKIRNGDYAVTRVHGDVIYYYRPPLANSQNNGKLEEEKLYLFKTARGYDLRSEENGKPATQESDEFIEIDAQPKFDPELKQDLKIKCLKKQQNPSERKTAMLPFNTFDYYCVVTTPKMSLPAIKERLNKVLGDIGFEYKLPEFEELDSKILTW